MKVKKLRRQEKMTYRKRIHVMTLTLLFLAMSTLTARTVSADDMVLDDEAVADDDISLTADGGTYDDAAEAEGNSSVPEDISGLFVDTGEDKVSHKGETLEEAREKEDPLFGSGDGGSTVNIGHLYEINGVMVRNSDFPSEHYECWTYANNVYAKIWGHNFLNLFNDSENLLRNLPDEELTLTPEHLKAYVSAAPAGAVLRVCDEQYLHADDGWGHSQIIISHDENGFTVFEGGLAAWPHRREAYFTWTGFCYSGWPGKYHYIKYVKWPGAGAYPAGAVANDARDLGESRMELLQPAVERTFQDLVQIVSDLMTGDAKKKDLNRVQAALDEVMTEAEAETESESGPGLVSDL